MDVTNFARWQQLAIYPTWEAGFLLTADPAAWEEADAVEQCGAVLEWAQVFDPMGFEQAAQLIA